MNESYFDFKYPDNEQLPRNFEIGFYETIEDGVPKVRVEFNGVQVGDVIDDNAYEEDGYRYHDVFHYSFATMLGWSPCTRAMLKRKRKSNRLIDKVEDGNKATRIEEAISILIFDEASDNNFFEGCQKVNDEILKRVSGITRSLEVRVRTMAEWELTILKSYELFRKLFKDRGGKIRFNMADRSAQFIV